MYYFCIPTVNTLFFKIIFVFVRFCYDEIGKGKLLFFLCPNTSEINQFEFAIN